MRKLISSLFVAFALLVPTIAVPVSAHAESALARFIQGGQPRAKGGKFASDNSPIPRQTVRYDKSVPAGTIIIETGERRPACIPAVGRRISHRSGLYGVRPLRV